MELSFDVNVAQLQKLAEKFPEVTALEMRAGLRIIAARAEKVMVEKTPRGVGAQGGLAGSIHGEVTAYGQGWAARIGTPLEYGQVIELGRRPGQRMPPVAPIALWAVRKLGVPQADARSVAYVIARKIAIKGFPGKFMARNTLKELETWIIEELGRIPARVTARLSSGTS
ncbi:MAG: hypothetical protein AB9866_10905 [Syntrophobacteraceae bacterium]